MPLKRGLLSLAEIIVKQKHKIMAQWTRKPQEQDGTYLFSGNFYATSRVYDEITQQEIMAIYADVKAFARAKHGIDYLQVYEDEQGRKLFFIDQLNREMIDSGDYKDEDNYCTLLFASEY